LLDVLNHFDRTGEKTLGERIIDQKIRHADQVRGARMFGAIPLQRSKVIRIAQLGPELLKNLPILQGALRANLAGEVAL
jgi:hypothetical protein